MPILESDIKLKKSQVMDDTEYSGGGMSNSVIVSGVSNQVFPDAAQLDFVYGNVSMRKVFSHVDTPDSETLLKSSVIVTRNPSDPLISITLFTTNDWFDRKTSAKDKVERYLAPADKLSGHILENMLTGQRVVEIVMREGDQEPSVGQGLVLIENELANNQYEQYIRITKISSSIRDFTVNNSTVKRKVLVIEISDPLRYDFHGVTVGEFESGTKPKAVCRNTRVADAARYYGVKPIVNPVSIGQSTVNIGSIFNQLVPSAQSESVMTDVNATSSVGILIGGKSSSISYQINSVDVSKDLSTYLGSPVYPSTLSFTLAGQVLSDSGGVIQNSSGAVYGSINYYNGQIIWSEDVGSTNINFNFIPAAVDYRSSNTYSVVIDQDNRGYNFVRTFVPSPSPTTLSVSYVSQNRVYVLRDDGNGKIYGSDPAYGSGTINYGSGTMALTLGALPDAGSTIIYSWGSNLTMFVRGDQSVSPAVVEIQLDHTDVVPNTISISWNGGSSTANDNGAGQLSGSGTGTVNYYDGKIKLLPNNLPNKGSNLTVSYSFGDATEQTINYASSNGETTFIVTGSGSLIPESVEVEVTLKLDTTSQNAAAVSFPVPDRTLILRDRPTSGGNGEMFEVLTGQVMGSIVYATRTITITPVKQTKGYYVVYSPELSTYYKG